MKTKLPPSPKKIWICATLILAILCGFFAGSPTPGRAAGFVVDSGADDNLAHDISPGDGICRDAGNVCTLRAAIEEANAFPGVDTITFDISITIDINVSEGALPDITDEVIIDARDRWDDTLNQPGVTIDGGSGDYNGLSLTTNGCRIYGLGITNFNWRGISITSANNIIGSASAGASNVIGHTGSGIGIAGSNAYNNHIQNNYLGIKPDGTQQANYYGVYIAEGAYNNVVGGGMTDDGNLIAGNHDGIYIVSDDSDNNQILGNIIGGATIEEPIGTVITYPGNDFHGILINEADYSQIGIVNTAGNGVVKNGGHGIFLTNGANYTTIVANTVLENSKHGILLSDTAYTDISGNAIGNNLEDGIRVWGSSAIENRLFGNMIASNTGKGIELMDGGNLELAAPTITSADDQGAAGKACAGCDVYVCSDSDDEGQFVSGIVTADSQGNWAFSGNHLMANVTALAVDLAGNTSEYSVPYPVLNSHTIFLPLLFK